MKRQLIPIGIFTFLLLSSTITYGQLNRAVLFLGNSYTASNNLPKLTKDLATSLGDTLDWMSYTPGGFTLEGHASDATSLSMISARNWDYVVLQDQSQRPSFSPGYVAANVYPFADTLARKINENDSCSTPLFYMTWGRKNGDAGNCAAWPPVCTYAGMQEQLRNRYVQMADWHGEVAPVGATWKVVRDSNATIELYNPDESHPSLNGSYLAACVFYASIFKKSPVGAAWPAGVDSTHAMILQQRAAHVVLDSLDNWFIDTAAVAANFTAAPLSGYQYQLTSSSSGARNWYWDFGDGSTSTLENPIHTFSGDSTYPIQLIVWRGCEADTLLDSLTILVTGLQKLKEEAWTVFPNPAADQLFIQESTGFQEMASFQLLNLHGQMMRNGAVEVGRTTIDLSDLPSGTYFLEIQTSTALQREQLILQR